MKFSETPDPVTTAQNTHCKHGICTDPALYLASAYPDINRPFLYATLPCNLFLLLKKYFTNATIIGLRVYSDRLQHCTFKLKMQRLIYSVYNHCQMFIFFYMI